MNTQKTKNIGNAITKALACAVIIAVVGLGALVIYDFSYLKMDGHAIVAQLKGIWEQGSVYLTTCGSAIIGTLGWSTVKLAQIMEVGNNYIATNKDFIDKVEQLKQLFVQTIRLYISLFIERQDILAKKQKNLNERLLLIEKTIYDTDVLNALKGKDSEYEQLEVEEQDVEKRVNETFNKIGDEQPKEEVTVSESVGE